MKPGNYKFLRVSESKNSKYGKNLSSNKFIMADNTITIIQDKFKNRLIKEETGIPTISMLLF